VWRRDRRNPQGRKLKQLLTTHAQHRPAGGEHDQAGAAVEQSRDIRCGVEHLFEVVEHQQHLLVSQCALHRLEDWPAGRGLHVERRRDGGDDQVSIGDAGKCDERRPIGELSLEIVSESDGEARLP